MKRSLRIGIGVDAGGTYTKIVAVTASGRLLREAQLPSRPDLGPARFVDRLAHTVLRFESELGARIVGVGLGVAGDVDCDRGRVRFSPNLRSFDGYPLRERLARRLGRPVQLENDANMAAFGGYAVELKRKARNLLTVCMGTGIGGGIVVGGRLYHGSSDSAGEIGHTRVEPRGRPCNCGGAGCVEAYAGAYGIVKTARQLIRGRRSLITRLCPDLSALEPRTIALAAAQGDGVAREVWRVTGRYLGRAIANAVYLLNPDAVLIAGGVSRAGRLILDPVRELLAREPFTTPFRVAQTRIARTPNLGAGGAGLLALE